MHRIALAFSLLAVAGLYSCKKTVSKKACFNFSKTTAKVGDTVFLFNCSEGYERCMWFLPNGGTDTVRHSHFTPTATGVMTVYLRVGNYLFTDTVGVGKEITVEP
jgi:hypothetical protein